MAIPDYFHRNAIAVSHAIAGFDEELISERLNRECVGISIGPDSAAGEARALTDLLVRLLSRLYPSLIVRNVETGAIDPHFTALAQRINPNLDFAGKPTIEIVVGSSNSSWETNQTIFASSKGWASRLSSKRPFPCGTSNNPFGAGLAACLAAAHVFRWVFLSQSDEADCDLTIPFQPEMCSAHDDLNGHVGNLVLLGGGAIGNAAVWALSRANLEGTFEIVDHETIDLGNLQRYVLAERADEGKVKVDLLSDHVQNKLVAMAYNCKLDLFLERKSHEVDNLLLALDSAKGRCAAQASLPKRIANAWTQPSDLGVSTHDFINGACVKLPLLARRYAEK